MGFRTLPTLDTRAVIGPGLAAAEDIKQRGRTGRLTEMALEQGPERFKQESRQRGLTARSTEQGIQTGEQLTRQAEKRFTREQIAGWLNIGLSSLPNVRSREEHDQWLSWMNKDNEVPLELLPILPEGMSSEQYGKWQEDYLNRAAKLKQDYELERIKARTEGAVKVAGVREEGAMGRAELHESEAMKRLKYQLMNGKIGAKPLSEKETFDVLEKAEGAYNREFLRPVMSPGENRQLTEMDEEYKYKEGYEIDEVGRVYEPKSKAPDRDKWMKDWVEKQIGTVRGIGKGRKNVSWVE